MISISSAEEFHAAVAAASENPLVACFFAPWSGGSKLVEPKVKQLAEELDGLASFANVSAEELETLCEEAEVDNFPHFRVYKSGKILGDLSSSKADKIDTFIRGLVAPETLEQTEERPEGDAVTDGAEEETTEIENESTDAAISKKRQEREDSDVHDEQIAKRAKIEVNASAYVDNDDVVDGKDGETAEVAGEAGEAEQGTTVQDGAVPSEKIAEEAVTCSVDAAAA
ncbi:putative thioredoxin [Plasmopara halstedii]